MKKQKIAIANWKMKLGLVETVKLAVEIEKKFHGFKQGEVVVCPNFISLLEVVRVFRESQVKIGAQDAFWEARGAYTGEISPDLLVEAGCQYVIIGHSERRQYLLENYEIINKELKAVLATKKITPIVCIGESKEERQMGKQDQVLFGQLEQALSGIEIVAGQEIIIAYEPVWAIGGGKVIKAADAEYMHKIIRLTLGDMFGAQVAHSNFKIIYGGSVDSKNIHEFVKDNIDGVLVGTASLKADEFYKIAKIITK